MESTRSSRLRMREIAAKENQYKDQQLQCAIHACLQKVDPAGFTVQFIDDYIGKGVFAKRDFKKGTFLLEYQGDLISFKEARRRELLYLNDQSTGSFMYFFKNNGKTLCVDATNTIFSAGRMVNDSPSGSKQQNSVMKIVMVDNRSHLCLFATRYIRAGEEIRYDYGVKDLPWRTMDFPNLQSGLSKGSKTRKEPEIESKDSEQSKPEEVISNQHEPVSHGSISEVNQDTQQTGRSATPDTQPKDTHFISDVNAAVASTEIAKDHDLSAFSDEKDSVLDDEVISNQHEHVSNESISGVNRDTQQTGRSATPDTQQMDTNFISDVNADAASTDIAMDHDLQVFSDEKDSVWDEEVISNQHEHVSNESISEVNRDTQQTGRSATPDTQQMDTNFISDVNAAAASTDIAMDHDLPVFSDKTDSVWDEEDSGSEYKPSESTESDLETPSGVTDEKVRDTPRKTDDTDYESDIIPFTESPSVNITSFLKETSDAATSSRPRSTNEILVQKTNNLEHITYDKKARCLFCNAKIMKLGRHLETKHPNETEVIEYLNEKDKSKKNNLLLRMRNIANHIYNCEVIRKGEGELAVRYRPSDNYAESEDYGPCPYCYGYFVRSALWRHKCPFKPEKENGVHKMAEMSRELLPSPSGVSERLNKVIAGLKMDEISRIAKSDRLIMNLGEKLCNRHGHDAEQHNYIRQKLREMSRLLKEMRKRDNNPNKGLQHFIDPKHYRLVLASTKNICLFDSSTNRYGTPSLALKLGHALQKCANILISQGIEKQDKELQDMAEEFKKLIEINWQEKISSNALKTLNEGKMNKGTSILPLAEDVMALTEYLKKASEEHHQGLTAPTKDVDEKKSHWIALIEIILAQIILFNRRRAGEVSKMKVDDFLKKQQADAENSPLFQSLTKFEQSLCKTLKRVEVTGKRGRTVPVLFTSEMTKHLDALIKARPVVVGAANVFLFPRVRYNAQSHLRGTDCLRKFALLCGAKEPQRLTSTRLRKQIATMSQILNMKENELDILANFLGHDVRVHRQFYRLPEATVQVAKVSKVLMAMEKGGKGLANQQSLESIELPEDEVETEEESDEASSASGDSMSDDEPPEEPNAGTKAAVPPAETTKNRGKKRPWTEMEKAAVKKHLNTYIVLSKLPGKGVIDKCKSAEPLLQNRNWRNVRDFCRNSSNALKRPRPSLN